MTSPRPDAFSIAITSGAIRALRRVAARLRQRAAPGVTIPDRHPDVTIVNSKSAHLFRIARDLDAIADDLEAERP